MILLKRFICAIASVGVGSGCGLLARRRFAVVVFGSVRNNFDYKTKLFKKRFGGFYFNTSIDHSQMASINLGAMRKAYKSSQNVLLESDLKTLDPFELFDEWFQEVKQNHNQSTEPNAVCLATSTKDGKPSARMVLLKGYDPVNGFTIFTNYQSRKGSEMEENPNVALLFYWDFQSRQIRIEGAAHRVPPSISDEYYHHRPLMSQISARISDQSRPIDSRDSLVRRQSEEKEYWLSKQQQKKQDGGVPDSETPLIPRPAFWGGFTIVPTRFEFWQGQSDRLHDRIVFTKNETKENGSNNNSEQQQLHSNNSNNGLSKVSNGSNGVHHHSDGKKQTQRSQWSIQRLQP